MVKIDVASTVIREMWLKALREPTYYETKGK